MITSKGGDNMTDNELLLAISNMLDPIREDIQEIKSRVKKIEIIQENQILPRLNNIESCINNYITKHHIKV